MRTRGIGMDDLHNRCAREFIEATEKIPKETITDKEIGFFKMGYKAAEKEIAEKDIEIAMLKLKWDSDNIRHCNENESLKEQLKSAVELQKQIEDLTQKENKE